jgi:hypothetical protein
LARARNLRRELLCVSGAKLRLRGTHHDRRDGMIALKAAASCQQERA